MDFGYNESRASPFEFGNLGLPRWIASDLALAFLRYGRPQSPVSRNGNYAAFKAFATFLSERPARRFSDRLLDYYAFLERRLTRGGRPLSLKHRLAYYDHVRLALATIRERPLLQYLRTTLPRAPHRSEQWKPSRDRLAASEFTAVLNACFSEIQATRENPPGVVTARVLLPFAIAIAARTWANPSSLFDLDLECQSLHPLDNRRTVIAWRKGRSLSRQYRSFLSAGTFEPPRLVSDIIGLTSTFRDEAPAHIRHKLFITQTSRYSRSSGPPRKMRYNHVNKLMANFIALHELPKFTIRTLRVSAIRGALVNTRNVRVVQRLANHAQRLSTLRYAVDTDTIELCNEVISEIQDEMRSYLLSDLSSTKAVAEGTGVSPSVARAIVAGENATLSGFTCRNPMEGRAPGTRAGELCTNFLACFRCENAVLGNDPLSAARLIQFRQAIASERLSMHPERFAYLYAWISAQLDTKILLLYDEQTLREADELVPQLPPLPPLS